MLLFLTLLFLPTQLGRHFWPQFSYIYSLPIDYLSPTIYFWDLLVILLMVIFIIRKKKVNKVAFNIFLVFILSQLISLIRYTSNDLNLGAGLVRAEQYLISGLFGVYIGSVKLSEIKSVIFWALGMAVTLETVLAVAQFLKGGTLGLWILGERSFSITTAGIAKFDFYGREFLRPYATFPHPNVLAAFMVTVLPLLSLSRPKTGGMFMVWSTVLGGVATILTVSRAALLAGFVEAVLLLRKKVLIWLALALIVVSPFIYTRFSAIFNFDSLSLIRREQLSEKALRMWISSPTLGVGLNNFIPAGSDQLLVGPSRFLQPVHNIFLLVLSETGVIGVIGVTLLIGYPINNIFKLFRLRTKNQEPRTFLLVWAMVIFLGMFDHYFLTLPQGQRMLFLVWGLSLSVLEFKNAKSS